MSQQATHDVEDLKKGVEGLGTESGVMFGGVQVELDKMREQLEAHKTAIEELAKLGPLIEEMQANVGRAAQPTTPLRHHPAQTPGVPPPSAPPLVHGTQGAPAADVPQKHPEQVHTAPNNPASPAGAPPPQPTIAGVGGRPRRRVNAATGIS